MPWIVGGAILGGALLGGAASSKAASTAASATEKAAQTSADIQREMFNKQIELQKPWLAAGEKALNQLIPLASTYKPFTAEQMYAEPGYQFRLSEGLKALDRQAAARGGLMSGSALKAAERYGQEYASGEYTNAFNRYLAERQAQLNPLQSLAGVGQTTAQQLGTSASNLGANLGQTYMTGGMQAGQARASGYLGGANALTGALGTGLNYFQNQALMNRLFPTTSGVNMYGSSSMGPTGAGAEFYEGL